MRIAKHSVVSIEYRLTGDAGQLLDSASREAPMEFLHGTAGILPMLERALNGKAAGEGFDVTITPDEGFGQREARLVEVLPLAQWHHPEQLTVGAQVERSDPEGIKHMFVITALDADTVTVDGNHPLSGMVLRFEGTILGVRAATAAELAGH